MDTRRGMLSPAATAAALGLFAALPDLLVPLVRLYDAVCARYPFLALMTLHAPPFPVTFLALLAAVALANGTATGAVLVVKSARFNRSVRDESASIPADLAQLASGLDLDAARLTYLDWPQPLAFCYGFGRPRIAITAGLYARLDRQSLIAVLAHEAHHLRRRDPLRRLVFHVVERTAFMVPLAASLRRRQEAKSELAADRAALAAAPKGALAAALLAALDQSPGRIQGAVGLSTTEARIAQLAGSPELPAIPASTVLATLGFGAIVGLATVRISTASDLVLAASELCLRRFGG